VLRLLEPRLAPGALVAADDNSQPNMAEYLGYVRDPASGYVTVSFPVEDGMESAAGPGASRHASDESRTRQTASAGGPRPADG
jgi:hypothetical protein